MIPSVRCSAPVNSMAPSVASGCSVLRDLIALGKIRIEIVLPREDRMGVHLAAERERCPNRQLHGPAVEHRERARQAETHGTQLRVGLGAEPGAAAAEDLGGRQELRMDLQADDRLERGHGWEIVPWNRPRITRNATEGAIHGRGSRDTRGGPSGRGLCGTVSVPALQPRSAARSVVTTAPPVQMPRRRPGRTGGRRSGGSPGSPRRG